MDNTDNYVVRNIDRIRSEINNPDILIVAVSKTVKPEIAQLALGRENVVLGENRVQEFLRKYEYLEGKGQIHFIGHLQKNKVKYLVGKTPLIHSVDSLGLIEEIEKRSQRLDLTTDILLQIKLSDEETKYGLTREEALEIIKANEQNSHVKIKGLMTMAPFTQDQDLILSIFSKLHEIFIDIKNNTFYNTDMVHLSMGMSNDYLLAVKENSNILRLGTSIFKK